MLREIMLFLEGFFTHFFDVAIKQKSIIYLNTYYFQINKFLSSAYLPKLYRGIYLHLISCSFHGTFSLLAPNKCLLIKQYKLLPSVKMLRVKE